MSAACVFMWRLGVVPTEVTARVQVEEAEARVKFTVDPAEVRDRWKVNLRVAGSNSYSTFERCRASWTSDAGGAVTVSGAVRLHGRRNDEPFEEQISVFP